MKSAASVWARLHFNLMLQKDGWAADGVSKGGGPLHTLTPGDIDLANPLAPRKAPAPAKAKRVIYLFMAGAPSQLDLFDDKPKLRELSGQKPPPSLMEGKRFAFLKGNETLLGTKRQFEQVGQSGMTISELLPHTKKIADEVCWLRGMSTDVFNHGPAKLFMNSGFQAPGRPSFGSWADLWTWAAKAAICPVLSCCKAARAARAAAARCGAAAFCRRPFKACRFAAAAMRF